MTIAFGLKAHSGWAALIALGGRGAAIEVVDRRRIELVEPAAAGWAKQPYHAAEHLKAPEARDLVGRGLAAARRIAVREMREAVKRSRQAGHEVAACAVLVGEPMPDWSVDEILAVHFRMHKAEGVLFRDVLLRAAETCEVRALGIPEKRLSEQAERTLRTPMDTLRKTLAVLGKSVGPPWGKDQKDAALAALIALRSAEGRLPIRGEFERSPMMAAFTVRKATDDDVPSIVDCLREAFEPYRDDYTAAAFADTVPPPAMLTERLSAMCLFVAVSDHDEIVGTVGYRLDGKEEGHLRGMAVRPDQQGSGVAQRLLDAVEEDLRRLGCARITLDTTAPLHRAVSFYERNGFRASGRVSDFHGMPLFEFVKPLESRR